MKMPQNALIPFFFILCLFLFALPPFPVTGDPDSGWHLAAGKLILETGGIPEQDVFSFTAVEGRWYNLSWLYDAGIAFIEKHTGLNGVFFITVFLYALSVALLTSECVRAGGGFLATTVCVLFSLGVIGEGISIRPQIITIIMCQLFYRLLKDGGGRVFLLPLLMALWVNLHGGFLAGFAIIGCFWIGKLISRDKKPVISISLAGFLTALATLASPLGLEIYTALYEISKAYSFRHITEWRAVEFMNDIPPTMFLILFVAVAKFSSQKITVAEKLVAVFWIIAGFSSIRFMQLASVMAAPFMAACLAERVTASKKFSEIESSFSRDFESRKARAIFSLAAILSAFLITCPPVQQALYQKPIEIGVEVKPALEAAQKSCQGKNLLNDYNLGGHLIYHSMGSVRVFVDGRAETVYSRDLMKDYADIFYVESNWKELLQQYSIGCVMIEKGVRLDTFIAEETDWRRVFQDEKISLYLKQAATP